MKNTVTTSADVCIVCVIKVQTEAGEKVFATHSEESSQAGEGIAEGVMGGLPMMRHFCDFERIGNYLQARLADGHTLLLFPDHRDSSQRLFGCFIMDPGDNPSDVPALPIDDGPPLAW